jgi:hypothetical protein
MRNAWMREEEEARDAARRARIEETAEAFEEALGRDRNGGRKEP